MLIRVLVILGLAYLVFDMFIAKNDDPSTEVASAPKPRKARKKKIPAQVAMAPEDKKVEEKNAETRPPPVEATPEKIAEKTSSTVAPQNPVVATKEEIPTSQESAVESKPPVEDINIADKKMEEIVSPKPSSTANADAVPTEIEANLPAAKETKTTEAQIDKSIDSLIDSVDGVEKPDAAAKEKKETKLEDKIVADDVYVPPPSYDEMGRGLVYNCKEKHWACVDKIAYVACNKNMKWNKAHGKAAECAVQNVYSSDDDCGIVQKYNVSINKETPFCQ
jgi:hypothetical protein